MEKTIRGGAAMETNTKTVKKLGSGLRGRAGEFFVTAELSRRGVWATSFAGNLPGYDLLVMDDDGVTMTVQIKTSGPTSRSKKSGSWWLGKPTVAHKGALGPVWVFVDVPAPPAPPRYFIIPESEVLRTHRKEPPGWSIKVQGWEEVDLAQWEDRWELITGPLTG